MTGAGAACASLSVRRIIGQPLCSRTGERLGQVRDVVVRLAEKRDPVVVGFVVRLAQRAVFVRTSELTPLSSHTLQLLGDRLDVRAFERRPREISLGGDLLGHHVISIADARLVRVRDVQLAHRQEALRAVALAVDASPLVGRLLPAWMGGRREPVMLPWSGIEPLLGHVPSARWRLPLGRLAGLHPARLADLVETASPSEGEEIIRTVGQDPELEADVFEELEPAHQIAHLRDRPDAEVAELLAEMAPDDAADLLLQFEEERRQRLLGRLPLLTLRKVRLLLGFNPETAGGLMSTDYLTAPPALPVGQVLEAVRSSRLPAGVAETVYVVDGAHLLVGALSVGELLRLDPNEPIGAAATREPASVPAGADIPQIALTMTDFNLTALPVVDESRQLIGVIAVDDLLEVMLPEEWRALVRHAPPSIDARAASDMPDDGEPAQDVL
jgi:CBS domain-containing protein/sporulation protein YlmC with PRC-barrel domain